MLHFILLAPIVVGGAIGSAYDRFRRKRLVARLARKPILGTVRANTPDKGSKTTGIEEFVQTRYSQRAAYLALGLSAIGALYYPPLGLASLSVLGYSAYILGGIFLVTLGLSYFMALSGLGAAGLLVPIYLLFGFPINTAKAFALFANTLSLSAATFDNLRSNRIDVRLGLPIIISSFLFAPVGAYVSTFIEPKVMRLLFAAFLRYVGVNALLPKKWRRVRGREDQDNHPRFSHLVGIGITAGLFSGLLGVGGGGVIAPLLLWMGSNAKKIAVITALAVPFSSFSGFVTYAAAGYVAWPVLATIGGAAFLAGFAGNKTLHSFLPERLVKYLFGIVSILLAHKILYDVA